MTDPLSTDRLREIVDTALDAAMYVCADCERAENHEAMCHHFDFVSIIGGEVICNNCADDGHKGEPRLPIPNVAALPHITPHGIGVKAIVWKSLPEPFFSQAVVLDGAASYLCNQRDGKWLLWLPGQFQETDDPIISHTYEEHRAAAQADYETRIRSALQRGL